MTIQLTLTANTNEELDAIIAAMAPPSVATLSDEELSEALRQRMRPHGMVVNIEPFEQPVRSKARARSGGDRLLAGTRKTRSFLARKARTAA